MGMRMNQLVVAAAAEAEVKRRNADANIDHLFTGATVRNRMPQITHCRYYKRRSARKLVVPPTRRTVTNNNFIWNRLSTVAK